MTGDWHGVAVGDVYPGPLPAQDGAVLDLLVQGGGKLLVAMANLDPYEVKALRRGRLEVGLLVEDTAILALWRFHDMKGRPLVVFDTPFDVRLIPPEQRALVDKTTLKERLAVPIFIVDRATVQVRGLRLVTLPVGVSDAFLEAVMDQLAHPELVSRAEARQAAWQGLPLDVLERQVRFAVAGKD